MESLRRRSFIRTMRSASLGLLISLTVASAIALADDPVARKSDDAAQPTFAKNVLPFLKAHCFHCHGTEDGKNKADLTLSKYTDDLSVQQDRKVWINGLNRPRAAEMPRMGRKRPPAEGMDKFVASIKGALANLDVSNA